MKLAPGHLILIRSQTMLLICLKFLSRLYGEVKIVFEAHKNIYHIFCSVTFEMVSLTSLKLC